MNTIQKYKVIYCNNKAPLLFKKSIYRTSSLKSFICESIRWKETNYYMDSLHNGKIVYNVHEHY